MPVKVIMPKLGESVVDGTVNRWIKHEGDPVEEFESLLEVETAKVTTEIPSPAAGVVLKILVQEGETVDAGVILAWVGQAGEEVPDVPADSKPGVVAAPIVTPISERRNHYHDRSEAIIRKRPGLHFSCGCKTGSRK